MIWGGVEPRRWQVEALDAAQQAIAPGAAPMIEAVMGAGKSVLIAELAAWAVRQGWRVLVSTPTRALVQQLAHTIRRRVPTTGEYYTATKDTGQDVTVVCYPSVAEHLRDDPRPVDLWICDEAHRTNSAREQAAYLDMQPRRRIALSATPYLSDAGRLSLWSALCYRYPMSAALRDGVLCPWDVVGWDGPRADIDVVMTDLIRRTAGPGVVDARSIEDAEEYAAALVAAGLPAAPLHSRMRAADQARTLARLRSGELRAVVHVSMLVEGVDLPWLSWLGLRRRVGSRVRFLQQLGRVLRVSPGKARATVLDPWGLMETHHLEYAAALGGGLDTVTEDDDSEPEVPPDESAWDLIDLPPLETAPIMVPPATARRAVAAWTRRVLHAATEAGIRQASDWEADARWRNRPASPKQLESLAKNAKGARWVQDPNAKAGIRTLAEVGTARELSAGAVSDLLDVLYASRRHAAQHGRGWAPAGLTIPRLPKRVQLGLVPVSPE